MTRKMMNRILMMSLAALLVGCGGDGGTDNQNPDGMTDATVDTTEDGTSDVVTGCTSNAECTDDPANPVCDTSAGTCGPLPEGHPIGWGDGSPESVTFTEIYAPSEAAEATDLEFHPERNELWVVYRDFAVEGECSQADPFSDRCASLAGWTAILANPGAENQIEDVREDANAWHFMRRPPALAMGTPTRFATCGEARTGNYEDAPADFIGATLWSTDLSVYARPSGGNGSHMDMLHATPWCMGIAHERDNVYWLFNGNVGSIDRYDFHADHGPGNDDHSDGEIFRYAEGELTREPGVPGHMDFRAEDSHLYIADTGNSRIVKLDTLSGQEGGAFEPVYEPLADYGYMDNATVSEVVAPGTLQAPSGLEIHEGLIYVTDNATSMFHVFDFEGNEVRSLDTGMPAGTLAGLEIGSDGKAYFGDMLTGKVYRIDPE